MNETTTPPPQNRSLNTKLLQKYNSTVKRFKRFLQCRKCSEAVLAKDFDTHVRLKHRVTKHSCPWCFGRFKYGPRTKGQHINHLSTCFKNYVESFPLIGRPSSSSSIILPPPPPAAASLTTVDPPPQQQQQPVLMTLLSQNRDAVSETTHSHNRNMSSVAAGFSPRENGNEALRMSSSFQGIVNHWVDKNIELKRIQNELKKQIVEMNQNVLVLEKGIAERDRQISEMRRGMEEVEGKIGKWKRKLKESRKEKDEIQQRMLERVQEEKEKLQQQMMQQLKDRQAIHYTTNV